jgi:hypothetical protein
MEAKGRTPMKRFWMAVFIAGVALAMAAPALATKPDNGKGKPGGPDDPVVYLPCDEVTTLRFKGRLEFHCEWSPSGAEPRPEFGTVTIEGATREPGLYVTDSYPGDMCARGVVPVGDGWVGEVPLVDGGESYWDAPTNWCSRFDPVVEQNGPQDDLNGTPLHLRVQLREKALTTVTITLHPAEPTT